MSILEGEGLFNDVTAIVLYHVAIAAAVSGTFSWPRAALQLVLSAVVAVAVGVALGWAANKLMDFLEDATLQIGLTLLVPYASYVMAEELHGLRGPRGAHDRVVPRRSARSGRTTC